MKKEPVLDALRKASKGLRYTSETDAPLQPFVWDEGDELTKQRLRKQVGATPDMAVEEKTLYSFLRAVPSADKAKFQKLAQVLKQQLSGIKVYKVGEEAEKSVYIVGKTKNGRWAGLKTTVVET
jgi:histidine triad (HIT) family protein